jgi:hypothetical protein
MFEEKQCSTLIIYSSGVLAGGPGGHAPPPKLAILGGRKNEKGAPIPRRILKVDGKKRI